MNTPTKIVLSTVLLTMLLSLVLVINFWQMA